jgi:hypothetical protein
MKSSGDKAVFFFNFRRSFLYLDSPGRIFRKCVAAHVETAWLLALVQFVCVPRSARLSLESFFTQKCLREVVVRPPVAAHG